jgi:hypothetical protein
LREGLAKALSQVVEKRPCPLVLGTSTPPTPALPLLSSLGNSILDSIQEKLLEIALKSGFLPAPKKLPQISPGDSAWHSLDLEDHELERCMLFLRGEASEKGKVWSALVHGADSLGSSTHVVAALAAAT